MKIPNLVGVRFTRAGRVHYFDGAGIELDVNDEVIVDAENGPQVARVVIAPGQLLFSEVKGPFKRVLSKAT